MRRLAWTAVSPAIGRRPEVWQWTSSGIDATLTEGLRLKGLYGDRGLVSGKARGIGTGGHTVEQPDTVEHHARPLVKVRCVRCGVTVLPASSITLTHESSRARGGTCWVRCRCGLEMLQAISARAVTQLRRAGVTTEAPQARRGPITRREVRIFKRALAQTEHLSDAARRWRAVERPRPYRAP
jgi:hypothetical protein